MDSGILSLAREMKQEMLRIYGSRLDRLLLFGSYARGDQNEGSDVDFMVVLRDETISRLEEINRFVALQSDLSLKHNVTISVLPVSQLKFLQSMLPVYEAARKEGVVL